MSSHAKIFCFLALATAAAAAAADSSPSSPPGAVQPPLAAPAAPAAPHVIRQVCAGSAIPSGWVQIGEVNDPGVKCDTAAKYNTWLIEELAGWPKGSQVEICRVKMVPFGWFMRSSKWNPDNCGHPQRHGEDNIMVIQRAH
jgi:hypothetical protein